jgi:peptidoglycan/LPS O-acetylase OafA/YrhL
LLISYGPLQIYRGGDQFVASLAALFYSTNLISDVVAGNMSHLWSLSVEEHFYFIWPVVVLFFVFRIPLSNRILFLIILIFGLGVFRIFTFNFINHLSYGVFIIDAYQLTLCRIDSILMGALLFFILSKEQLKGASLVNTSKGNLLIAILLCAFFIIMLDP